MTQMEETKVKAQLEKYVLRKRILEYQIGTKGRMYMPKELKDKTLKQLQKIWEEIERRGSHV